MSYVSLQELVSELPVCHVVKYLDDEQLERCYIDAYMAHIAANDPCEDVREFLHHVWENTDMAADWAIDEKMPQHYVGIPDKGKTHDAVDSIWHDAFNAGIEHCIQWLFGELESYYNRYVH